jgi:hypothetical protein
LVFRFDRSTDDANRTRLYHLAGSFGEFALLTDQGKSCPQPGFKGIDEGPAFLLPDVAAVGEFAVTGIAVDLQNALEALQVGDRPFGFTIGRVDIGNTWWIRPTPGAVIGRIGPKLTSLGAAAFSFDLPETN